MTTAPPASLDPHPARAPARGRSASGADAAVQLSRAVLGASACAVLLVACGAPNWAPVDSDDAPQAFVGQARLRTIFVERDGFLVSPLLETPRLASRVGAWFSVQQAHRDDDLLLEARGWREDGSVTPWLALEETWADPVLGRLQRVGRADLGALVVAAELRLPLEHADRLAGIVWSAVIPAHNDARDPAVSGPPAMAGRRTDAGEGLDAQAPAALRALDIEGVEPRSAWGARNDAGCNSDPDKTWITVHHTVSALNEGGSRDTHAAAVRGIQALHMDTNGWCDIGYHFAVTADGTVWEARQAIHLGAHTRSNNTNNAGIVFVGCFHPTADCNGLGSDTPPQGMLDAGGVAIGAIARRYDITINDDNVIGHRDNPDQATACPGDNLHELLPTLRSIADTPEGDAEDGAAGEDSMTGEDSTTGGDNETGDGNEGNEDNEVFEEDDTLDAVGDGDPQALRVRRVTLLPPDEDTGGCASAGTHTSATALWVLGLTLAVRNRRRAPRGRVPTSTSCGREDIEALVADTRLS